MSGIDWLFGRGAYGYVTDGGSANVENTYVLTLVSYGLVGLLSMAWFLLQFAWRAVGLAVSSDAGRASCGILSCCLLLVFLAHAYTLDVYVCYTIYFAMALFRANLESCEPC